VRHLAWAIVLAGGVAASPALAQVTEPVHYDWSGFYIGAHLGGGLQLSDVSNPFGPSIYGDTVRTPGPLAGGQAGYNWQFGRTLLGVEADVSWANFYGTNTCFAYSGFYVSANCVADVDAYGTFTGRAGWLLGADGGTLIYGKAGGAWLYSDVEASTNGDPGFPSTSGGGFRFGWTLGAGAERMLSERWSVRGEYDYLNFGSSGLATPQGSFQTVPSPDPNLMVNVPSVATKVSQDAHLFKVGINYRLGEPGAPPDAAPLPRPINGTTFEIGARYVYGWGRFQKDLGIQGEGLSSLASRLTYSGMNTTGGELFARADLPNGLMAKGFIGSGNGGGSLNDEDWGISGPPFPFFVPYSNTWSKVDDEIRYGVIDLGYDLWRDREVRVTPFVGYSQFHQYMRGYGCVQLANPNSDCGTPIPVSVFAIAEDDTWHALRLGIAADIQVAPGLTLTADAAYLPYVRINGVDDHVLRTILSPEWANGTGAQLELILAYAITDQLKIGIGGRYWNMWTDSGTVDFGGGGNFVPMRFSVEQAALLFQGSLSFDSEP
jgi:opacity protein-like surface antigen